MLVPSKTKYKETAWKKIPENKYFLVNQQIDALHKCLSKEEYEKLLNETLNSWKSDSDLHKFYKYFSKQWVKSIFCNWQIFNTKDILNRTSPISSPIGYNKTI